MELSYYLKTFTYNDKPHHLLLFSTKKASIILIHKDTFDSIQKGTLSPSNEALLTKLGMVVPDRNDEKKTLLNHIDDLNQKNTDLRITAVLNLDWTILTK